MEEVKENFNDEEEILKGFLDNTTMEDKNTEYNERENEIQENDHKFVDSDEDPEESKEKNAEFDEGGIKSHLRRLRKQQEDDEKDEKEDKESKKKESQLMKEGIKKKEEHFDKKMKQHVYNLVKGIGVNISDKQIDYQKNEDYMLNLKDLKKLLEADTEGRTRVYIQQLSIIKQDLIPLLATSKENTEICEIVENEKEQELSLKLKNAQQISKEAFIMKDVIAVFSVIVGNQIYPEKNLEFIENILKLVVNLLKIETKDHNGYMNEKLLIQMKKEKFLDILLFLLQEIGDQFMKYFLEILSILLVNQSGLDLAIISDKEGEKIKPNQDVKNRLLETVKNEKEKKEKNPFPLRHSRFGGPLVQKLTESSKVLINSRNGTEMIKQKYQILKQEKYQNDPLESITSNEVKVILKGLVDSFIKSSFNEFMRKCFDQITSSEYDFDFEYHFLHISRIVFEFNRIQKEEYDVSYISELFGEELMSFLYQRIDYKQEQGYFLFKKFKQLEQAVGLLKEIFLGIEKMATSSDSTTKENALSLLYKSLYDQNNFSNIPKLIAKYRPNMASKRYLFDLFEISHCLIKLLKNNEVYVKMKRKENEIQFSQSQFIQGYSRSSIISNYMKMLNFYNKNSNRMNHMIVKLLSMVAFDCKMEPRFYQISNLNIFSKILNDSFIQEKKEFKDLILFSKIIVKNFIIESRKNPNMFIDLLFVKSKSQIYHEQKEKEVEENVLREELIGENEFEFTSEAFDETIVTKPKERKSRKKKEKGNKRKRKEESDHEERSEEWKEEGDNQEEDQVEKSDEEKQEISDQEEEQEKEPIKKTEDQEEEEYNFGNSIEIEPVLTTRKSETKTDKVIKKLQRKKVDIIEEMLKEDEMVQESEAEKDSQKEDSEEEEYSFQETPKTSVTPVRSRKERKKRLSKEINVTPEKNQDDLDTKETPPKNSPKEQKLLSNNTTPIRSRKKKKMD